MSSENFKSVTRILLTLSIVVASFVALSISKSCKPKPCPKLPKRQGHFEARVPVHKQTDTLYLYKWRGSTDTLEVQVENPLNDSLLNAYGAAKDSLERFKMFAEAIGLRDFSQVFEDSNITVNASGVVQGVVKSLEIEYTIKEKEQERSRDFYIQLGAGSRFDLQKYKLDGGAGFRLKNGNMLGVEYSRMGSENFGGVKYIILF